MLQPYRAPLMGYEGRPALLLCAPAPTRVFLSVWPCSLFAVSSARPLVPSRQESMRYYQPARLCSPPPAMAFTALSSLTCAGVLIPTVGVPKV